MIRTSSCLPLILLACCSADTSALDASSAPDSGVVDVGVVDGGAPDSGVGDAGPPVGSYDYCIWVGQVDCFFPEDCERYSPIYFDTGGHCQCRALEHVNWRESCLGKLNGLCRESEPFCDQGVCEDRRNGLGRMCYPN